MARPSGGVCEGRQKCTAGDESQPKPGVNPQGHVIPGESPGFIRGEDVKASLGVARLLDGESPEKCRERADKALYRAKQNGRNRVEISRKE